MILDDVLCPSEITPGDNLIGSAGPEVWLGARGAGQDPYLAIRSHTWSLEPLGGRRRGRRDSRLPSAGAKREETQAALLGDIRRLQSPQCCSTGSGSKCTQPSRWGNSLLEPGGCARLHGSGPRPGVWRCREERSVWQPHFLGAPGSHMQTEGAALHC